MIVYNTCTTKAKENKVPQYEILVWIASVILYKYLGYTTKLYCSSEDIPFLKREHIYELYDEINTDCFDNTKIFEQINMNKFWSSRKLEAMNYELKLNPDSIYSDTDVLMYQKFNLEDCDALFWTVEPENKKLYIDWNKIPMPEGYKLKKEYKIINDAYNCGVMWFKDPKVFNKYYAEYKKFVINNSCDFKGKVDDSANNILACNSEQRLLKAVLNDMNLKVNTVSNYDDYGISETGIHIFMHKRVWHNMVMFDENSDERLFLTNQLNELANGCFKVIYAYDINIYNFLSDKPYFKVDELKYYG